MSAITGVSALPGGMDRPGSVRLNRESFTAEKHTVRKKGRCAAIVWIDWLISGAGAVVLALSAFYFAPIVGSIFLK